jgi:hypothetical protein
VADRDSNRLSLDGESELLTTTRGVSSAHERDRGQVGSGGHSRILAQPWGLTPSWAAGRSPQPICSASSTMIPSGPRT